jgi:hypothetical protein
MDSLNSLKLENMTHTNEYKVQGRVLGGRPDGQRVRESILEALRTAMPDAVIRIDLADVQTLDFSAADEILSPLIARVVSGELGTRRFYLAGVTEGVREGLTAVLTLRKRVCLELGGDDRVRVLGPLSAPHEATLRFAIARGSVTAADVASEFWKEPKLTAATNRLNTLVSAGLLLRDIEQSGPRGARNAYRTFIHGSGSAGGHRDKKGNSHP